MMQVYYGSIYKHINLEVYIIAIRMMSNGYIEFEVVGEDKPYTREVKPEIFQSIYRLHEC